MIVAVILIVAFCEKKGKVEEITLVVCKYFVAFFCVCFLENAITGKAYLYTFIVRRVLYMPTYLNKIYYDFFLVNPKTWFTQDCFFLQNVFSRLFGSSYNTGLYRIISINCFRGLIPSPNNGLFSEAFPQMGYLGIFVFPFIYYFIIGFVGRISSNYGKGASAVVMAKLSLIMLSTSILASGRLVGIIVFWFITYLIKQIQYTISKRR